MNERSPEEKLLNLIKKGTDTNKVNKEGVSHPQQATQFANSVSSDNLQVTVSFRDLCEPLGLLNVHSYHLNSIHRIVSIVIVGLLVYSFYVFLSYFFSAQDISLDYFKVNQPTILEQKEVKSVFPLSHYLQFIGKRKLFKTYVPKKVRAVGPMKPTVTIEKKLSSIRLLGIIWDEGNAQAIVEDRKNKKTYYVYEGDSIGDIVVQKIEEGRAIFRYGDEEQELTI